MMLWFILCMSMIAFAIGLLISTIPEVSDE